MQRQPWLKVILLFGVIGLSALPGRAEDGPRRDGPPNILFLLADDLGYGDPGCFGQRHIRTPNLDRLAHRGMRLTHHYSGNAVCAPSRCVLMTGKHPGHAFIRDNRGTPPEGQYPIPTDTVTLPKLLRARGYVTGGFGKWGLGGPGTTGDPLKQGFDRFFGFNCQSVAHNYYPTYLWDDAKRQTLRNPRFSAHQRMPADADASNPKSYEAYAGTDYAPDLIAEQARQFLRANKNRPFFLYFPTTVPHLALQVPEDSLAEYQGKFPETPYRGDKGYLPHPTPRAAYAAMVTRMDREIGTLLDLVRDLGLENNTIIVFSSDNGPLYDRLGGTDTEFFHSARELKGRKGSLFEGGIRVPTIAAWQGVIPAGTQSDRVSGFEDWLPTLLELAGLTEAIPSGTGKMDGISMAATLKGGNQPARPFLYREFPGYGGQQMARLGDWKAVRQNLLPRQANPVKRAGKKATSNSQKPDVPSPKKRAPNLTIQLYNLRDDPSEQRDVASAHPEIVAKFQQLFREQHTPSPEFPLPALDRD